MILVSLNNFLYRCQSQPVISRGSY